MRESLARVLSGLSNLDEGPHERPVDRLHAIASAQIIGAHRTARASKLASLGTSLIAFKVANRADEYGRAVSRLTECLAWIRPRPSESIRLSVATQAIYEHCIDFCPTCHGATEIPAQDGLDGAQRMKVCPDCGGHGKRLYTDQERAKSLKIIDPRETSRLMGEALGLISRAEDEAVRTAARLLERWK